jgi:hypothetical protein
MPDVSAIKRHHAHTTCFFEQFVLTTARPVLSCLRSRIWLPVQLLLPPRAQPKRGLLTRSGPAEVTHYRARVDVANFGGCSMFGQYADRWISHDARVGSYEPLSSSPDRGSPWRRQAADFSRAQAIRRYCRAGGPARCPSLIPGATRSGEFRSHERQNRPPRPCRSRRSAVWKPSAAHRARQ